MQRTEQEITSEKIGWLINKSYLQGIIWMVLCCFTSAVSDALMKCAGHLNSFQVVFIRSLFGLLILAPFIMRYKRLPLRTVSIKPHINRTLVGAAAITLMCYSTTLLSLPKVTVLSFSQPLFLLPMAVIFLKEKITKQRLLANFFGFCGVLIALNPQNIGFFAAETLAPITSALLFTYLDIVTKKLTYLEKPLTLVLYFYLGVTFFTGIVAVFTWSALTQYDLILLCLLGMSALLNQTSSLMSLSVTSILSLAPLRYAELIFSCFISIFLFQEAPAYSVLLGGALIISSVLYITYVELT